MRNEREIYGLVIIQYSRMGFTNHSSYVDVIPLDAEIPLSRRTISSRNKQTLNPGGGCTSNNKYSRYGLLSIFLILFNFLFFFLSPLLTSVATVAIRSEKTKMA